MNASPTLLRSALEHEAERAGSADIDLAAVFTHGGRRRRRRTALTLSGTALAGALVAGTAFWAPWPADDQRSVEPAGPTSLWDATTLYGVGKAIHVEGRTIETPTAVHNLVPTTTGAVYVDAEGAVFSVSAAGTSSKVGTTSSETPYLFGGLEQVAWTALSQGDGPATAEVLDVDSQRVDAVELSHSDVVSNAPLSLMDLTDGVLSMSNGRAVVQVPVDGSEAPATVVDAVEGWTVIGGRGTTLVSTADEGADAQTDAQPPVRIGAKPGDGATVKPIGHPMLSPDGTRVLSYSEEYEVAVQDVRGRSWSVAQVPGHELAPFAWVDEDTWVAIAFPLDGPEGEDESAPLDLMRCTVADQPSVTCEVAVDDFSSIEGGFTAMSGMTNY